MLLRRLPRHLPQFKTTGVLKCRHNSTKSYYITTPIFYPNAVPHIGHLYSLVVGDVFARYQRLLDPNRPVKYLAGTDEHGLKIQKAAQTKGLPPDVFCDELSDQFRRLSDKAQISHTRFMRTTERTHYEAVEYIWRALDAKGLIYKGDYSGWYSITDECFYTSAQVTPSTCPSTGNSTTISIETGAVVEWHNEQNYMFKLSQFQESLLAHYTSNPRSIFPEQHHTHIVQILSAPLEDLSISRPRARLSWGVQVPDDPEHTIYVWFDALIVYLSGMGYPWKGTGAQEGWPVDLQIIGKDILRFHSIYLPAILQALGLPLQKQLLAHAHWTTEQKKMSKSLGNVADPFEAIEEFGIDIVRYYLARIGGRFRDDVDWSREQLDKHNKELQSLLGNFFLRVTSKTIHTRMASAPPISIQEVYSEASSPNRALIDAQRALPENVRVSMDSMEVSDALGSIIDLLRLANKTITDTAPWKPDTTPAEAYAAHVVSVETLRVVGICLQPFVPKVAGKLLDALEIPVKERAWEFAGREGRSVKAVGVRLFQ
ncbi:tRNA synthetases class I (M)-domain-containing protein [Collybia nuda]|uniref:Probable methionine--tRNA ligase, mitochondrial n=1 Tax=Collybia nuda TaxID=64659 RepID=A0A9P6CKB2_9AGAR|nr:tRNA synthetases class I (M)-domain-containing protein [Collybia nuda]